MDDHVLFVNMCILMFRYVLQYLYFIYVLSFLSIIWQNFNVVVYNIYYLLLKPLFM